MLYDTPANANDARVYGLDGHRVKATQIGNYVQHQARTAVRVEIHHVAQTAVGQRWTEDRNLVLGRPIVDGRFVVDALAQPK